MNNKDLYTLRLKFKRHNLTFDFDESTKVLTIGKNQNLMKKYLIGGVIVFLCLFLAGLVNRPEFPISNVLKWGFIILSGYGFTMIANAFTLSKNNKYKKVFTPHLVELVSKKDVKTFQKESIKNLNYEVSSKKEQSNGQLFLTLKNDSKIKLLDLIDKERKHLKSDLEFLVKALNTYLE